MQEQTTPYTLVTLQNGTQIALVGTAHISQRSVDDVEQSVQMFQPDTICIELDEKRFKNIQDPESWKKVDLFTAFRQGQGFLITVNLILANYQRRMGEKLGVKPGAEMLRAIHIAQEQNIPIALCDRNISTTLKRAWCQCKLADKVNLINFLLCSSFSSDAITEDEISQLKQADFLSDMLAKLTKQAPVIKRVLIDERDTYLAQKIYQAQGQKRLVVIGAGHMQGVIQALQNIDQHMAVNTNSLDEIPPKPRKSFVRKTFIPALLLVIFFFLARRMGTTIEAGKVLAQQWLFWKMLFGALGGVLALAHPLLIFVNAVVSPFTALVPIISSGTVTALVQLLIQKPRVQDFEGLAQLSGVKSWYRNRISHLLIVWMLCSLVSSIGTFVALARMAILPG